MKITHNGIELHQLLNTMLLAVVGFFAVQTYRTILEDHEKLAKHETRITVVEGTVSRNESSLNILTGRVEAMRKYNR